MLTELKPYPQWVIWRYLNRDGKATKIPFNPKTGVPASVTEPSDWSNYEIAVQAARRTNADGIGFVLTANDPFTFIDLDSTDSQEAFAFQQQIFNRVNTYAEFSPSGNGLHLIAKAAIGAGVRDQRFKVELYDRERYMTITENPYRNVPITQCQDVVTSLVEYLKPKKAAYLNANYTDCHATDDERVFDSASTAANGQKFMDLWAGNWQKYYQSQSEADLAIINILGFFSDSKSQIHRMFLESGLGQRDKAKADRYVLPMLDRAFDQKMPAIDLAASVKLNYQATPVLIDSKPEKAEIELELPDGVVGELAKYIFDAAPRPNQEVALATAIGVMAGICGRSWNVSGTGLNQYVFIIGKTGIGKDAINLGIGSVYKAVTSVLPQAKCFFGPSEISSPQALNRYLAQVSPCFLSYCGEIGKKLQEMQRPNASASLSGMHRMALNLYAASGHGKIVESTIYSDKDKNIQPMISPSFTWMGESTPEIFYGALTQSMVADGLIPRFLIIETQRSRPPLNELHLAMKFPDTLASKLTNIAATALANSKSESVTNVTLSYEADLLFRKFNQYCDDRINAAMGTSDAVRSQLWNRAHLKSLKLAALIAVGRNPILPQINESDARWAIKLEKWEVKRITARFDGGDIVADSNDEQQLTSIRKKIGLMLTSSCAELGSAIKGFENLHNAKLVPMSYLLKVCFNMSCFKTDRLGPTFAIKRALRTLVESGEIKEVSPATMSATFGRTCVAYSVQTPESFGVSDVSAK
jgi:hypothetical protein